MTDKKRSIFRELLWKYKWLLCFEILFQYAVTRILIIGNKRLSYAIDLMLEGNVLHLFDRDFILWLVTLTIIGFSCSYFRQRCATAFSIHIQTEFREKAIRKLFRMEYSYFDNNNSSSVMNKLIADIDLVSAYYSETLPAIIITVITSTTILISMWKIDKEFILFFIILFPVILLISQYATQKIGTLQKRHWELQEEINEIAFDNVQGIVVGKSFHLFPIMKEKIYATNKKLLQFEFHRHRISMLSWVLNYVVKWIPHLLLGILILHRVVAGELSLGIMTYLILMLDYIIHPLSELMGYLMTAKTAYVSRHRLDKLMEQPEEKEKERNIEREIDFSGNIAENKYIDSIQFKNIQFGYNKTRIILNNISFQIKKGEQVAFVGESGEGKSTILKLLCGFYQQQHGEIFLYGTSLDQWEPKLAREQMAIVSQNIYLFPESIAWNIACGKETCTQQEIEDACKKANIHDFILSLPNGYQTMVGERGAKLSGGEKQRIAVARAILKNAPILLLDEATSALDNESEYLVQNAIQNLKGNKTIIMIAHRPSTIAMADYQITM